MGWDWQPIHLKPGQDVSYCNGDPVWQVSFLTAISIKIWDGRKGTLIHTLTSHGHWVNHICLSTDYALRTGFWDHKGKKPATEEERIEKAKKSFEKAATLNGKLTEHLVSASDDNVSV